MKICIVGGGFTGLVAAYYLAKKNHQITIFEKESYLGGMASSFKEENWRWSLEKHYHHFFSNDKEVKILARELNLSNQLFFQTPVTSIYYQNSESQFDTPLSLLSFPYFSIWQKMQTGIGLLFLKLIPGFKYLETVTAFSFLEKIMGKKSFKIIWKPLFVKKFGRFADKVNSLWIWARVKKRTKKLGYFLGGTQTLIDGLVNQLKKNHVEIFLNKKITKIVRVNDKFIIEGKEYDRLLVTAPIPTFLKLCLFLPKNYLSQISQITHLSSLSLVLVTDKPLLKKTYWLNINDESIPFVSLVCHTNFIDKKYYGNSHITYIGAYLLSNHPFLAKSKEELLEVFLPYLKKISHATYYILHATHLFKDDFTQTVVPINYSNIKPTIETPIKNLYLGNIDVVYPWDRGVNYAIELGQQIANKILENVLPPRRWRGNDLDSSEVKLVRLFPFLFLKKMSFCFLKPVVALFFIPVLTRK